MTTIAAAQAQAAAAEAEAAAAKAAAAAAQAMATGQGMVPGAGMPPAYMDDAMFVRHVAKKAEANASATSWLIGLGLVLLILGIILQLIFCSWWWAIMWGIGIILIIAGAAVYAHGSSVRSCLNNPTACRKMMSASAMYGGGGGGGGW